MNEQLSRTKLLYGVDGINRLKSSRVAVFGLGGVGGHCAEALVRCGLGTIDIIDDDIITPSNLNRQIIALHSTLGQFKVEAAKKRFEDINPEIKVIIHKTFYDSKSSEQFDLSVYDYIVDAIDTIKSKVELIVKAKIAKTPIISSMGAANKTDPSAFHVEDIYKTSVCPLAKVMRHELRKNGIEALKVVYSKQNPLQKIHDDFSENKTTFSSKKRFAGSNSFVPAAAGLILAGEVIHDLIGDCIL